MAKGARSIERRRTPAVVIHGADHALAAVRAASKLGMALRLESAPAAAGTAGAAWFLELVRIAAQACPDVAIEAVLDCGDAAGHALGALRMGARAIRFTGRPAVRAKIAAIARQSGARVETGRPGPVLDLAGADDPEQMVRDWLAAHHA